MRAIGVTEVAHDRWRQEHGGLKTNQVRRLKALELQNQRLRRAVADLTLDKQILAEAAWGVKGVSEPVRWSGFSPEMRSGVAARAETGSHPPNFTQVKSGGSVGAVQSRCLSERFGTG